MPALREELVTALIRSLPKELRRNFVPAPDTARAVLAAIHTDREPLLTAVRRELRRLSGISVPADAFDLDKLPAHLRVTFAVESPEGTEIARGKDLITLQEQLATPARHAVARAVASDLERSSLRSWPDDLDVLPRVVERDVDGRSVRGFPSFVDAGNAVNLRVFATPGQQQQASGPGIRRLLRLSLPAPVKTVEQQLDLRTRLLLGTNPDGSLPALIDDCADAAVDASVAKPVWTREEFAVLRERIGKVWVPNTVDIIRRAEKALAAAQEVHLALPAEPRHEHAEAITDVRAQLDRLLPPGFVTFAGATRLNDLTRYLNAIRRRLDQLPHALNADHQRMSRVHAVQNAYDELLRALPEACRSAADVKDIAWQIEELRVSLWAQQLGTPRPISEQRIYRAIDHVVV